MPRLWNHVWNAADQNLHNNAIRIVRALLTSTARTYFTTILCSYISLSAHMHLIQPPARQAAEFRLSSWNRLHVDSPHMRAHHIASLQGECCEIMCCPCTRIAT